MRGMPFQFQQQGKGLRQQRTHLCSSYEKKPEPTHFAASTLSSSFNGGGGGGGDNTTTPLLPETSPVGPEPAAGRSSNSRDEWVCELQSIPSGGLEAVTGSGGERCGLGMEDWDTMLSETAASPGQDQSLLRWISGDVDDASFGLKQLLQGGHNSNPLEFDGGNAGLGMVDQGPGFDDTSEAAALVPVWGFLVLGSTNHHQFENLDEKPQILNPQLFMNQSQSQLPHQNPTFFLPVTYTQEEQHFLQSQPKRHNPGGGGGGGLDPTSQIHQKVQFSDPGHELLLRKQHLQQQQQPPHFGNFPPGMQFLPQQHHIQPRPVMVPKQNKVGSEEMAVAQQQQQQQLLQHSLLDQLYKAAEMFVNFTCNQALLEAVSEADQIHIVDFDIGFGAHWASFMQELPLRNRGGASPSLKITAFASPSTHHTRVELGLMRDNLTQFASEIGLGFELEVVNIDLLDQNSYSLPFFRANDNEAVAVNFPIWSSSNQPAALPNLLRFVKQLSPKIVVSLDRGCDRSDLPFPQHILQALQSYINLLESLDAVNVTSDAVNKIERFLLQPKIESTVLGRLRALDKMPLWKTLFASAGFTPLSFSNFTETQAECVVKRSTARGFHVEKRQESLVLCWQRRELISASAWVLIRSSIFRHAEGGKLHSLLVLDGDSMLYTLQQMN
ncbi:hypothetical protein M0R45_024715 [Rubus argutus]|uniref:Uncharacterized protein n=1 Tax=Rubus argutus TaxID=59490 RepID=A0AAW1WRU0_RUBAR